jgi:4-aminobutyrate--pyruvate transaminase
MRPADHPVSSIPSREICMPSSRATTLRQRDVDHILHPYSNPKAIAAEGPLVIARGEGVYVYDIDGRRYLEGMAGLWSTSLGFSEPRLAAAAARQFARLPYSQIFGDRSHEPAILLAEQLTGIAPDGLNHVLFANSGSESIDAAVKIVWYYHNQIGKPAKKKLIGRINGYHGVTVAGGSLTGQPHIHADFDLPISGVLHTDSPSYYHFGKPDESVEQFVERIAANLEALILREGPETIGAFFAEPVMGSGGVIVPPPDYFERIQAILRKYDILFVVDEVITGFGRTGELFGSFTYDLKPDLLVVAKALSSSYLPISGLLLTDKIHDVVAQGAAKNGVFAHGITYAAHPVCAAVALETLAIYQERDIVGHVKQVAPSLQNGLAALQNHPLIGEVRGVGLLGAVELTRSKSTRAGFDPKLGLGGFIQARALAHGVIVRALRDAVVLCPPLIINAAQIEELLDGLRRALDDGLAHARDKAWI